MLVGVFVSHQIFIYRHSLQKHGSRMQWKYCGKEVSTFTECYRLGILFTRFKLIPTFAVMEMLDKRTQEFELQLSTLKDEYSATKERLTRVSSQEAALVHQNAKMSVELAAEEKRFKKLESELKDARSKLSEKEAEALRANEELQSLQSKLKDKTEQGQKDMDEKSKVIKEYQDKV